MQERIILVFCLHRLPINQPMYLKKTHLLKIKSLHDLCPCDSLHINIDE